MQSTSQTIQLIGFEKDSELGSLLASFGLSEDYGMELRERVLNTLREQHPEIVIESIELLTIPKCNLGGMKDEQKETLIRVQTLDVPLDLRVTLRVGSAHLALDIQFVLKYEGLDSTPTIRTDMFVKGQRPVQ